MEYAAAYRKIFRAFDGYEADAQREVEFLIVLAVIALLMMGYLGYALVRPERF